MALGIGDSAERGCHSLKKNVLDKPLLVEMEIFYSRRYPLGSETQWGSVLDARTLPQSVICS